MANQETQKTDNIIASRRAMLLGGGAVALAAMAATSKANAAVAVASYTDNDILNFALNLEYLEANFYYMAAFGCTIDKPNAAAMAAQTAAGSTAGAIGIGAGTTAAGATATYGTAAAVPFTMAPVKAYAIETAIEEGRHVTFLRSQLGSSAVSQPNIDISPAGAFTSLGNAAGVTGAPLVTNGQFNPYANDVAFLAGAYVFEDVGVTAYKGAAPLITTGTSGKAILAAAAAILSVEAYHAGLIRTTIYLADPNNTAGYLTATQLVSKLRANLSKAANTAATTYDDFGLYPGTYPTSAAANPPATGTVSINGTNVTASNIANADPTTELVFSRTTTQVLNIVTGGNGAVAGQKATGVFFPSGLNGTFA